MFLLLVVVGKVVPERGDGRSIGTVKSPPQISFGGHGDWKPLKIIPGLTSSSVQ